jgi:hypothetical protein
MLKWAGLRELADELLPFFRRDAKHPGLFLGCFHGPRSTSTSPDWLWKQTEVMISWAAFRETNSTLGRCESFQRSLGPRRPFPILPARCALLFPFSTAAACPHLSRK